MVRSRIFIVALDALDPTIDQNGVRKLVKSNPSILGWWNHIPGCFLVSTQLNAEQLADEFRKATHEARLLVMEVNAAASEGWLPEASWQWIRKRETEKVS